MTRRRHTERSKPSIFRSVVSLPGVLAEQEQDGNLGKVLWFGHFIEAFIHFQLMLIADILNCFPIFLCVLTSFPPKVLRPHGHGLRVLLKT